LKLLNLLKDSAFFIDAETGHIEANGNLSSVLGYDDLSQLTIASEQFLFPLLSSKPMLIDEALRTLSECGRLDCRLPRRDGGLIQVELRQVELPHLFDPNITLVQVCNPSKSGVTDSSACTNSPFADDILDNIGEAVFLAPLSRDGVHGNFVYVNRVASDRLGYGRDDMLQMNARTINPNANQYKVKTLGRAIQREGETIFGAIHVAADGTEIPVDVSAKIIAIAGTEYVLSTARDKRQLAELNKMESRFARLIDHSWDEIYIFSSTDYRFLQANQGALNNLGYSSKELCELRLCDLEPEMSEAEFKQRVGPLFEGHRSQVIYETKHKRKNGSHYPVEIRLQLSYGEVPPVFLANVQDITDRKKIENRLQFLAKYDSLTGLPNRVLFLDRLTMAIEQCKRNEKLVALLYLDLDGFKRVNDSRGHLVGDELLKQVAIRIESVLRRSDTVARLGGDEFCIITTNLRNTEDVEIIAANVINEVNKPYLIKGGEANISTSVGICFYPFDDNDDSYHLMQKADAAMYRAKKLGKNNVQYYTEVIALEKQRTFSLESDLETAFTRGEFFLVYQPKLNLEKMEITGVEALLRWAHPEKGTIMPLDFIYLLEKSGKIQQVGAWVLAQACARVASWNNDGHRLRLSVNVSAKQLESSHFPRVVRQALEESGINANELELEISENVISDLSEKAVSCIRELKQIGVRISLDDFGSGYSSINYIKRLTVNSLKIDSEFVSDCEKNPESIVIVDSIMKLADGLRVHIVAEGIETEYQLNLLKSYGCQEGQGFYFDQPLTAEELDNKLNALSKMAS